MAHIRRSIPMFCYYWHGMMTAVASIKTETSDVGLVTQWGGGGGRGVGAHSDPIMSHGLTDCMSWRNASE